MVELNSSFYAIPSAHLRERWVRETPDGFLFDVKCHCLLITAADAYIFGLLAEVVADDAVDSFECSLHR